ncbi:uncharacterized protein LOC111594067 [Drosophila hydei]|uniref:Uncharacterized protein LOC111594067 n=1 Tax=Drosophila hydei TaxID=7224 RepID=A0A6J1LHZ9_DROHY|nr:uncharacterized protein LOC111594067 [Drosophila hydei]
MSALLLLLLALLLTPLVAAFGNEYVHIKVHVPKDQAPTIAVDAEQGPQHNVIHHFHHHSPSHQRLRGRATLKPKSSPLLESVILSDLDKPLHMSEHADYLNHAKELAEHLSESYSMKKMPTPPKKKVNTYTIIEEKYRPYDYERPDHVVDTYRVIDNRPQKYHKHHHHKHSQHQPEHNADDVGYQYAPPARQHRHKPSFSSLYHGDGYAEPAPVDEPWDLEQGYNYTPPNYAHVKSAQAPAHTLEAPEESSLDSPYPYDFSSSSDISGTNFRPSPQLSAQADAYDEDIDAYAAPIQSRRRHPGLVNWPSRTAYNNVAAETYSGTDSYNVGHVQGGINEYQYPGPYL